MITKADILGQNPNLSSYQLSLNEVSGVDNEILFDCYAEDDAHASEQALSAYPDGQILTTTKYAGNGAKSAKELAEHCGHTSVDSVTTLKTENNPDTEDGADETMDLNVSGFGDAAYLEWVSEYGDPIGDVFKFVDISDEDLPQSDTSVVYSPNEAAISDSAGYWNNEDGWVTIESASKFKTCECQQLNLPISTGGDARWVKSDYRFLERSEPRPLG